MASGLLKGERLMSRKIEEYREMLNKSFYPIKN
jgi:hypothetical protein